jgi:hypothetical protein
MADQPTHPDMRSGIRARWFLWLAPIAVLVALALWVIPDTRDTRDAKDTVGVPVGTSGTLEAVRGPTTMDALPGPDRRAPAPAAASTIRHPITGVPGGDGARRLFAAAAGAPALFQAPRERRSRGRGGRVPFRRDDRRRDGVGVGMERLGPSR